MRGLLFLAILTWFYQVGFSQFEIRGILMGDDGDKPVGAVVKLAGTDRISLSDQEGRFVFSDLPEGEYQILVSHVSYETYEDSINLGKDLHLEIKLKIRYENLEEIVIHDDLARVKKENSALSLEIVNDRFLETNRGGSLMQSLNRLPGVDMLSIGSGQSKPVIRGLSFNRVAVSENGIKHEAQQWGRDHGLEIDQYSAEHIEIIKGPASLSYGSDAIGGVIDIRNTFIPAKQSLGGNLNITGASVNDRLSGSLKLYGRKERLYFNSRITISEYADYKIPADSILYYSYYFRLADRRMRNTAGNEQNLKLVAGWKDEGFHSRFIVSSLSMKSGFFANTRGLEIRRSDIDYDKSYRDVSLPYQKVHHLKILNRTEFKLLGKELRIDAGFQRNFRQEFAERVEHGYMPLPPDSIERQFMKNTFSLNAGYFLRENDNRETQLGFNAEFQDNQIDGWGFILPEFRRTVAGIFITDSRKVRPNIRLNTGLRYDIGNIIIDEYSDWYTTPVADEEGVIRDQFLMRSQPYNNTFQSLSGGVGLIYSKDHFTGRFNLGKGFRMPGAKELGADGINYHLYRYESGNNQLKAESSWQVDLGAEWNFQDFAIQLSPFVNYFPNYIYLNPTSEFREGMQVYNYGESKVFRSGGELHTHWHINRFIKTGLIGEYIYSVQLSGEKKGFTLPFSPPASVLWNVRFFLPPTKSFHNTSISIDNRFVASQKSIVPPEQKTDGYYVLNLVAGTVIQTRFSEINIDFRINNLFNRKYFDHTAYYRLTGIPEPGRNFLVEIGIPFNVISNN